MGYVRYIPRRMQHSDLKARKAAWKVKDKKRDKTVEPSSNEDLLKDLENLRGGEKE